MADNKEYSVWIQQDQNMQKMVADADVLAIMVHKRGRPNTEWDMVALPKETAGEVRVMLGLLDAFQSICDKKGWRILEADEIKKTVASAPASAPEPVPAPAPPRLLMPPGRPAEAFVAAEPPLQPTISSPVVPIKMPARSQRMGPQITTHRIVVPIGDADKLKAALAGGADGLKKLEEQYKSTNQKSVISTTPE